jgi:hypothetical protein
MRTRPPLALGLVMLLTALARADADKGRAVTAQKKAAEEAWKAMDVGEAAHAETKHLLIFAPRAMEPRLKAVGALLEKYHDAAAKAVNLDEKDAYPGKIAVFLFAARDTLPTFVRRVEKRRPESGETATFGAKDDELHAAAAPGAGKIAAPVEARAGEMVAAVLIRRKAKVTTPLPEWLTHGFGRATSYKVLGTTAKWVNEERKAARALVRKYSAWDVWGGKVEGDDAEPVRASLAEFMTYGFGPARLEKLLTGFLPGENMDSRTTAEAVESTGLTTEKVGKAWKAWVK